MEDRYYIVKFGKFLTFLSIVFMIAIPIMIIHKMNWISSSIKTTGTIVGYMEHTGTDSTRSYAPIFTFRDERSKIKYEIVSSTGSNERPFEIGEAVEVLYDPDDPTDAIIDSFERKWLLVIFLIIMALITKYLGHMA